MLYRLGAWLSTSSLYISISEKDVSQWNMRTLYLFTDAKVDIKTCNQYIVLFVERETVLMKIRYEPNYFTSEFNIVERLLLQVVKFIRR